MEFQSLRFKPEPTSKLAARWPQAVERTYDVLKVAAGLEPTPGKTRRHVFDFKDGMRLIVSIDKQALVTALHVSGSAQEGSEIQKKLMDAPLGMIREEILNHLDDIDPHPTRRSLMQEGPSGSGVYHILFNWP